MDYTSNLPRSKPDVKIIGTSYPELIGRLSFPLIPFSGICFGHQIVGRAFGGTCARHSQWDVGISEVQLTEIGQCIFDTKAFVRIDEIFPRVQRIDSVIRNP